MYDIIIIGAGTAGLTAAIYAARASKQTLLLEKQYFGGQIVVTPEVENYPGIQKISGAEFAKTLHRQAIDFGAAALNEEACAIEGTNGQFIVQTAKSRPECRKLILATGARNRPLGIAREAELVGHGVSYCAACDGFFYRGKTVAVVGGGNTALEDTLLLAALCEKVILIHRRSEFRGEAALEARVRRCTNVELCLNATVTGLHGEARLEGITVHTLSGKMQERAVSGLFVAIGQIPQNEPFREVVQLDRSGYIAADETCRTTAPGIFCAGDCRSKTVRQLSTAASDGTIAALSVCNELDITPS